MLVSKEFKLTDSEFLDMVRDKKFPEKKLFSLTLKRSKEVQEKVKDMRPDMILDPTLVEIPYERIQEKDEEVSYDIIHSIFVSPMANDLVLKIKGTDTLLGRSFDFLMKSYVDAMRDGRGYVVANDSWSLFCRGLSSWIAISGLPIRNCVQESLRDPKSKLTIEISPTDFEDWVAAGTVVMVRPPVVLDEEFKHEGTYKSQSLDEKTQFVAWVGSEMSTPALASLYDMKKMTEQQAEKENEKLYEERVLPMVLDWGTKSKIKYPFRVGHGRAFVVSAQEKCYVKARVRDEIVELDQLYCSHCGMKKVFVSRLSRAMYDHLDIEKVLGPFAFLVSTDSTCSGWQCKQGTTHLVIQTDFGDKWVIDWVPKQGTTPQTSVLYENLAKIAERDGFPMTVVGGSWNMEGSLHVVECPSGKKKRTFYYPTALEAQKALRRNGFERLQVRDVSPWQLGRLFFSDFARYTALHRWWGVFYFRFPGRWEDDLDGWIEKERSYHLDLLSQRARQSGWSINGKGWVMIGENFSPLRADQIQEEAERTYLSRRQKLETYGKMRHVRNIKLEQKRRLLLLNVVQKKVNPEDWTPQEEIQDSVREERDFRPRKRRKLRVSIGKNGIQGLEAGYRSAFDPYDGGECREEKKMEVPEEEEREKG
jgi:hypothetical protein